MGAAARTFGRVTDKPKQLPHQSAAGESVAAEREARLAAALRANLQRRKAQARSRAREEIPRSHGGAVSEAKKP
jgi:hypothetical protein